MNRSDFDSNSPGRLEAISFTDVQNVGGRVRAEDVEGVAFLPDELPPKLTMEQVLGELYPPLIEAERSLSQLEGAAHRLANPHLLIGAFGQREARLSSQIENTFASPEDLAMFDDAPSQVDDRDQVREVRNYMRAIEHGLASDLPICNRLIKELHAILLDGTSHGAVAPGSFRQTQNAIGSGRSFQDAKFIPPHPKHVQRLMDNLESFINDESSDLPRLIRFGLVHYQFEAIHPFLDGNGRIGRLLIAILMCRHAQLSKPLVYISGYFEQKRSDYYELLYRVSTRGAWIEWLHFFLDAVATQSTDALHRADSLLTLQSDYHAQVREKRASSLLPVLIDMLFAHPSVTVAKAQAKLKCTPQTAINLINKLIEKDILYEATGRKHGRVFLAPDILNMIYS